MSRIVNANVVRTLLIAPVVLGLLVIGLSIVSPVSWPIPAQIYLKWYISHPMSMIFLIFNRLAFAGMVGILFSTFAVLLSWSTSRYFYLISVIATLLGNIVDAPSLCGGFSTLIEDICSMLLGVNLLIMFMVHPALQVSKNE